jgi:hypothetical protein
MRRESGDCHIRHEERRVPPGWLGVGLDLSCSEWCSVVIRAMTGRHQPSSRGPTTELGHPVVRPRGYTLQCRRSPSPTRVVEARVLGGLPA